MVSRILSTLSLTRKAGFLKMGFDPTWESIGRGATAIFYTTDISPKTKERMEFQAKRMNVRTFTLPHTTQEVFAVVGKNVAVMSLCHKIFTEKIISMISEEQAGR